jgi:hypothetical protein
LNRRTLNLKTLTDPGTKKGGAYTSLRQYLSVSSNTSENIPNKMEMDN